MQNLRFNSGVFDGSQRRLSCSNWDLKRRGCSMVLFTAMCFFAGCASEQARYHVDSVGIALSDSQLMSRNVDLTTKNSAKVRHAELSAALGTKFDSPVKILHNDFPSYPAEVRMSGIEGVVSVQFIVNEDGQVGVAKILSSPDTRLSEISLESIKLWRFAPLTINGLPSKAEFIQKFPFKIVR